MNWDKFKQKFGVNTTSNLDLIKYAGMLKLKPFKCIMRDEIESLKPNLKKQYIIVNIQRSDQEGAHWSAIYTNNDVLYFFDSYALPPEKYYPEVKKKFKNKIRFYGDQKEQI